MKKILCCFVVLAMMISVCSPAMASDGKVEISFCVGDDTLIINGSPVTVEKPYVVGDGVTLVPIRVITEAFDAKVDWVSETKTVKLTYPDVNIVIQIDNPVAEVNGRAETLLEAPQLTEAGYTMIPLRFISENFGADVSYDNETKRIIVTKEKSGDLTVSIEGSVNSKYIGDSFFNWSMENPLDMSMEERSFDGMETFFADSENEISIEIFTYDDEDYDFESEYNEAKLSLSGFTLVKTDKDVSDENCKRMHIGVKDKNDYYDYQQFATPEYVYIVSALLSNEDTKTRDKYLNILSTFKCSFENDDIYDLSNIKDGFKKFESEQMKISFNVPENFYMATSEDSQNRFEFYEIDEGISSITAVIYSKSDVESASSLAAEDYDHNKEVLNEKITKFSSGIVQKQYGSISATEYTYTVEAENKKYHTRDVFFEMGDYVYNVAVSVELPNDNYEEHIDKIINSIKAEPLNSEEVGILMKNMPTVTGTINAKIGNATITLPNIYVKMPSDDTGAVYIGAVNGVMVSCIKMPASDVTTSELRKMMKNSENMLKEEGAVVLKSVYERTINNKKYQAFRVKSTDDEGSIYFDQFVCIHKGYAYILSTTCPEIMYSESTKAEIDEIIGSITFE